MALLLVAPTLAPHPDSHEDTGRLLWAGPLYGGLVLTGGCVRVLPLGPSLGFLRLAPTHMFSQSRDLLSQLAPWRAPPILIVVGAHAL